MLIELDTLHRRDLTTVIVIIFLLANWRAGLCGRWRELDGSTLGSKGIKQVFFLSLMNQWEGSRCVSFYPATFAS